LEVIIISWLNLAECVIETTKARRHSRKTRRKRSSKTTWKKANAVKRKKICYLPNEAA